MYKKSALVAAAFMMTVAVFAASPAVAIAAEWTAPVQLSAAGANASGQQVVVDANGLATAVWLRGTGTNRIVQSSTSLNGGAWSTPVNLSVSGTSASLPALTVAASGLVTAVWRFGSSGATIQSSTSLNGGVWSTPVNVSVSGATATSPALTVDASGLVTAVWTRFNGSHNIIQSASSLNGGAWSIPVDLSAVGQNAVTPQVAVSVSGLVTAVWQRNNGTNTIIQSASSLNGGAWSTPVDLSSTGQNAKLPQVVVDSSGLVSAVWVSTQGFVDIIQSASSLNGGAWSTPVNLSSTGQSAYNPQVVVDSSGLVSAVWARYDGSANIIQSSTSLSGAAWSTPINLSTAGGNAVDPELAVDSSGLVTAVWIRPNGSNDIVQSASSLRGAAWSTPLDASEVGQDAALPQVAVDASGLVTAVWYLDNGSNTVIQSSTLDNPVAPTPPAPTPPAPELAATGVSSSSSGALLAGGAYIAVLGTAIVVVRRHKKTL